MSDSKLKIIIDQVGRTIIGEVVEDNDTAYVLKNAATIVHRSPDGSGKLLVHIIPLFFTEFIIEEGLKNGVQFTFNKATITDTTAGDVVSDRLFNQYKEYFDIYEPSEPDAAPVGNVVELFDE